jgi:hypothetical protein
VLFEVIADGLFKLAVDAKGSSSDLPVGSKKCFFRRICG